MWARTVPRTLGLGGAACDCGWEIERSRGSTADTICGVADSASDMITAAASKFDCGPASSSEFTTADCGCDAEETTSRADTDTVPSLRPYLIALSMRLPKTCSRRFESAETW